MKNVYKYGFVCKYCEKVFEVFGVDLYYVLFVLNYCVEVILNDVKNVMFFFNIWCVFNLGKCFIECYWNKKDMFMGLRKVIY